MLLVGQSIPKKMTDFCFVRGKGHPLLYGHLLESLILADARDLLAQSRESRYKGTLFRRVELVPATGVVVGEPDVI